MTPAAAVVVCHNTPNLIREAVESMAAFHPKLPILIVDGSDTGHECQSTVRKLGLQLPEVRYFTANKNVGHGDGLHLGISMMFAKNILVFDSDIEVKREFLLDMLCHEDFYGVGHVITVDPTGMNAASGIHYLHPYCALINREKYFQYAKFRNAGEL